MDQAVFETLSKIFDADANIRGNAEKQLQTLQSSPEFPVSLVRLSLSQELSIPQRQLAAVTLKQYIETHWSEKNDKFVGPEPPEQVKHTVRELLLRGLSDPDTKIRVANAYAVSKIAHIDWPEEWPNLFNVLLELIKSSNANDVHGAMRVLTELVSNDLTVEQFPQIAPVLCPQLLAILTNDAHYSLRTRGRAVSIFRNCLEMVFMIKEEHAASAEQFLAPILPQWHEAFLVILKHQSQGDEETRFDEYGLKLEIVKCINMIIITLPKFINPLLPKFFEPIWMDLLDLRSRYINEFVSDGGEANASFQDSDGDIIGFESLLYAQFEFVVTASRKKSMKAIFLGEDGSAEFLKEVLWVTMSYMQMTEEQVETWLTDANQFVADEEDDTYTYNVRVSAIDLLTALELRFPKEFFPALGHAVQRHLAESNASRAAGKSDWWKIQEACLMAVGRTSEELIQALQDKENPANFDLAGLFEHVVLENMKLTEFPFAQGRAFVFASEYAQVLPTNLAEQYVRAAVEALQAPEGTIPVKISALKALNNFCKHLDPQFITGYQQPIMEGSCQLLPTASEESLLLLLETLTAAIKINKEVTARYESVLIPSLLEVWKNHPSDSLLASYVLDLFDDLAKNELIYPSLCGRVLPYMREVLVSGIQEMNMLASAIDMIAGLARGGPSPLLPEFVDQIFPPLMHTLWTVKDNEVLQSGQQCLKTLVGKDSAHLIQWRDQSGKTGLQYVVEFVANLLQPDHSESEAMFVGDLIVKLIQKAGNDIGPVLPDLLNVIIVRLTTAKIPSFIQSMILVFAHLINTQLETVFQFLVNVNIDGRNGLEILLPVWCENHDSFSGFYALKVSTIALSKLFLLSDQRLQGINVQGEIIVPAGGRIVTRSRSKQSPDQYTTTQVPIKIVKLLVSELNNAPNAENAGGEEYAESGDEGDGEWEDDDEDSPFAPADDFAFLSEFLEGSGFDEDDAEEENDPDLKNDPIFQTNLKDYLTDFFRNCASHNVNQFMDICQHHLNQEEKSKLEQVLNQ
ncbi:hypothetical protein VKS41_003985 [Umbelopsis sp. WA50703]